MHTFEEDFFLDVEEQDHVDFAALLFVEEALTEISGEAVDDEFLVSSGLRRT
jgi:hypothetical protein